MTIPYVGRRDEALLRSSASLRQKADALDSVTRRIKLDKKAQRRLVRDLRKGGLSARFLARVSDMSPQTVLNIAKKPRP